MFTLLSQGCGNLTDEPSLQTSSLGDEWDGAMASTSITGPRKVPDEKYLAFAVCIVHSKPAELSIDEYISLLRQHVTKGRRENALSSVHRHLDKSAYWRSEYERVQEALESAGKEKLDLRLEVDRLKVKPEAGSSSGPSKKRKKQDDCDVVPVPRSPKRPKQVVPEKNTALTPFNVDEGFSFAHLGEPGNILMRSFYQAHALLKSHSATDPTLLAQHLVHAGHAVSDILQHIAWQSSANGECDVNTLKGLLNAISRAMRSLLVGYVRVSNVAQGVEVQGQLIYAYVQILEKSTIILGDFAKAEAMRAGQGTSLQAIRPSTSKGKAKQVADPTAKPKRDPGLSAVSSFITGSIDMLDVRTAAHKPIFEGLAYVLIEKLATCLYTLVFGRPRGATIEEEIVVSARPDDIEEADCTNASDLDFKAAKLEAPYLIQLLTRLMQVAPAHFGTSGTAKGSKSKASSKIGVTKDNLAITAKERLQRTLMNCMFGTEGADEEDPFLDCLRKPAFSGPLPALPAVKEADVQEWFKEEVWRLLGWDILARDGGW